MLSKWLSLLKGIKNSHGAADDKGKPQKSFSSWWEVSLLYSGLVHLGLFMVEREAL